MAPSYKVVIVLGHPIKIWENSQNIKWIHSTYAPGRRMSYFSLFTLCCNRNAPSLSTFTLSSRKKVYSLLAYTMWSVKRICPLSRFPWSQLESLCDSHNVSSTLFHPFHVTANYRFQNRSSIFGPTCSTPSYNLCIIAISSISFKNLINYLNRILRTSEVPYTRNILLYRLSYCFTAPIT